jgi:hypothetical protein
MADDFPVCLDGERLAFMNEHISHNMLPGLVHISRSETPGSSWDGASVPRWAWSIMGHPLAGDVREASYWHDRICEGSETPEDRMVADAVFLMILRRAGVSRWRRWAMWFAVRFYAVVIWRGKP